MERAGVSGKIGKQQPAGGTRQGPACHAGRPVRPRPNGEEAIAVSGKIGKTPATGGDRPRPDIHEGRGFRSADGVESERHLAFSQGAYHSPFVHSIIAERPGRRLAVCGKKAETEAELGKETEGS